jgi:glycosyltransferase involved in cell wall biosynthesis
VKLLFINTLYQPNHVGGAEKSTQLLAEGLREAGHEVAVVTCDATPGTRVAEVNGVTVYYVGLKNLYWPYSARRPYRVARAAWHAVDRYNPLMATAVGGILQQERPDAVSTQNLTGFSCSAWRVAKRRGVPLYHTLRDYSLMCPKASMYRAGEACARQCRLCRIYTSPSRRLSAEVDGVVGISRHVLETHLRAGYFLNVGTRRVIHNAVGVPSDRAFRSALRGGPLRLGFMGQLTPEKGIGRLVDAMHAWPASKCQLVVAGRGMAPYESELRRRAPENVHFLGFVSAAQLFAETDVLVVPSIWPEPFGRIVIEAYAHGVPVIASDCGGLPELVEHRRTGILYASADSSGLSRAIATFLDEPGLLEDARALALEKALHYGLDRHISEYRVLFEQRGRLVTESGLSDRNSRAQTVV